MTELKDLGLKIIDIHKEKLIFLLDGHHGKRPDSAETDIVLLENSELAWMKPMQECVAIYIPGVAACSHVTWIKTIKSHTVTLQIQQHANFTAVSHGTR